MKRRKYGMKINDTESLFKILLSGVPQGILFNIFINDLLFFVIEENPGNFPDDNTICAAVSDLNEILRLLEKQSGGGIEWFSNNNMIVNPN